MRRIWYSIVLLLMISALLIAGCSKGASLSGILQQNGITGKSAEGMKVELRFLQESRGSNYKFTDISSNKTLISQMLVMMQSAKPAAMPDGQYTPEIKSDYEIVFTGSDGTAVPVYYAVKDKYLIYPDSKTDKNGTSLEYLYFTPDIKLAALIASQDQNAALKQANDVKPFRSLEELKSSIHPDELAEAGTEIDFEFFTDATPENTGTACRVYTSADFSAIPQDSYLITAYGKGKAGQREKLSITAMEANTNYTKITVEEPDDTLGSVDTGADAPESYAITVKKAAIDPGKWIVFVNDNNDILDVIPPEDIATVSATLQPAASASPSVTATASSSAVASATAGASAPAATASAAPTDDASVDEN